VTNESWTSDRNATCPGPVGLTLTDTHGNGYVVSDTLLKREIPSVIALDNQTVNRY